MEQKVLDFEKDKVVKLTLAELQSSCSEAQSSGKPLHGIEHHQIYSEVVEMLEKNNIAHSIMPLYAADGGDANLKGVARIPYLEDQFGSKTLPATILRRVIGGIKLSDFEDDDSHGMIAINFHQRGIQLAYGQSVKVCSNMTIMGANNCMSTYQNGLSRPMPDFRKMLEVMTTWVLQHGLKRTIDTTIMNQMRQIHLTHDQVAELIGFMTFLRVARDKFRSEKAYPINQTQVNVVTERYLSIPESQRPISLWNFYNHVTELHKAGSTDLPLILDNNIATGQFLVKHFGIAELPTIQI